MAKHENIQEDFWSSDFGKNYSDRNSFLTNENWDQIYVETWGHTKIEINESVMDALPRDIRILEVGCNIGLQLKGFQRMGFNHLYGIELQDYAVEKAKKITENINIIQGSGFDLPFKDGFFDLVCTNGVLIHISPENHYGFMSEVVRCSKKFVMGWEYFSEKIEQIDYRGNAGYLWKADFAQIYMDSFSELEIVKRVKFPYIKEEMKGNADEMFLLQKKGS